ncbi:MAG: RagB/SusD family nutrient uptake outer membrane protein [Muribaculaceae bacterium]|nr:RagB/SusD family nutrient uptake outer membrane protein [Muribaculaceae bacterium]
MKIKNILMSAALLGSLASCDMNEVYYSDVLPDNLVHNEQGVFMLLGRAFNYMETTRAYIVYEANEQMADVFICPTRVTGAWFEGGIHYNAHYHTITPDHQYSLNWWDNVTTGIANCVNCIDQIKALDYKALGIDESHRPMHIAQAEALMAYYYLRGMDWFGGLPIYESQNDPLQPRATMKATFEKTESLIKSAIANLETRKTVDQFMDGYFRKGAAAMLLAQLYLNAETYIGVPMYNEAAKVCEDIINGVYGPYELDAEWQTPFGFDNHLSHENMWSVVLDGIHLLNNRYTNFFPSKIANYFGIKTGYGGGANQWCLAPSRNPEGKLYKEVNPEIKLGSPYEKFDDGDLRKQLYHYNGNRKYEGMFLVGELSDPRYPDRVCVGTFPLTMGKPLVINDWIAPYSKLVENGGTIATKAELPSTMENCAEEGDGVRIIKYAVPDESDNGLYMTQDHPVLRLAEAYYTLAECKMRLGDKKGAAELINTVRKRNFENGNDPNPVTEANLDKWRMLDEWLIEFLGEGRRRIDLVRWGVYHTEKWWDHEPTNDANMIRLPIPTSAFGANALLKQNPGYGGNELTPEEM